MMFVLAYVLALALLLIILILVICLWNHEALAKRAPRVYLYLFILSSALLGILTKMLLLLRSTKIRTLSVLTFLYQALHQIKNNPHAAMGSFFWALSYMVWSLSLRASYRGRRLNMWSCKRTLLYEKLFKSYRMVKRFGIFMCIKYGLVWLFFVSPLSAPLAFLASVIAAICIKELLYQKPSLFWFLVRHWVLPAAWVCAVAVCIVAIEITPNALSVQGYDLVLTESVLSSTALVCWLLLLFVVLYIIRLSRNQYFRDRVRRACTSRSKAPVEVVVTIKVTSILTTMLIILHWELLVFSGMWGVALWLWLMAAVTAYLWLECRDV